MNRRELLQALKTPEDERRQADLPDLHTLLDEEAYNATQRWTNFRVRATSNTIQLRCDALVSLVK
ncbi:MAG: hypothetical protein SXV54_15130 [Chloroflexota bacterium]|nr:hypothetical protein [Chloroflexota bacterium]